jgi:hypothetical protein
MFWLFHAVPGFPDSIMAPANSGPSAAAKDRADVRCAATLPAPADSPKMVTRLQSPPKAPMLSRTHLLLLEQGMGSGPGPRVADLKGRGSRVTRKGQAGPPREEEKK